MKKNRIDSTFENLVSRNEAAFIPFVVLGDPDRETTLKIVKAIEPHSDVIEVGIPFSDPMADGPTIQGANQRAFAAGMNTDRAFDVISKIRDFTEKPLVILTYFNLLLNRTGDFKTGVGQFFKDMDSAGADGVIIADLPVEEVEYVWDYALEYNKHVIFLVSPATTPSRFKKVQEKAGGYLYLVSVLGVTGARDSLAGITLSALETVNEYKKVPVAVGFGISRPDHVRDIVEAGADGAIVGSAIVKIVEKNLEDVPKMLHELGSYAEEMKNATRRDS
ncbi:MAG: tryptophan synthase subunit alpha [Promethearchaeota archaeon]